MYNDDVFSKYCQSHVTLYQNHSYLCSNCHSACHIYDIKIFYILNTFHAFPHLSIFSCYYLSHYYSCSLFHTFHLSSWCSSVALQITGGITSNTLHLQCSYLCSIFLCWFLIWFVAAVAQLKFHLVLYQMEDYLDIVLLFLHDWIWKSVR